MVKEESVIFSTRKQFKLWLWCTLIFAFIRTIPMLADFPIAHITLSFIKKVLLIGAILCLALFVWNKTNFRKYLENNNSSRRSIRPSVILTLFLGLILILWLPPYLALYPGTFGADAPIQEAMFRGLYPWSDHHPILHTLVLGAFIQFGITVFDSATVGLGFYTFIAQLLFCAVAVASSSTYLYRKKVPLWIITVMVIGLCINPYVQVLVCYSTKDIPFAAAFLLFIVNVCYILFPPKLSENKASFYKKRAIITCLLGFLAVQLRSQGLYIIMVAIIVLLFYFRKNLNQKIIRLFFVCQVTVLITSVVFNMFVPIVLGSERRDSREALAVPIQQMSAALTENENAVSPFLDEELTGNIKNYFDGYDAVMYNKYVADVPKSIFKTNIVNEDPLKFVQTYIETICANPSLAIRSYVNLVKPYFDFTQTPYNNLVIETSFEDLNSDLNITHKSLFPTYEQYLTSAIRLTNFNECPLFLKLFDFSWVLYLLGFLLGVAVVYKSKLSLICFLYPFLYIGTMFLGPMALLRYAFIYVLQWPFYGGCIWISLFSKNNAKDKVNFTD
ncbi:DUF6020 family protein [uncultured Faecalibaculum sp.]|uniref:DUF6020 family protein n=1 Tax=uncultured Faecalibaculum sp. TaxID=1729681 RepID=UPI00272DE9AD|nr:DUF6020 family protein [uncultured Faecalibaculum sp.]